MINTVATDLYRAPSRIFEAADRGEPVTIRRKGREYVLTRKTKAHALYGCLKGTVLKDEGKAEVKWKAQA
jgi:hypothetical protein